MVVGLEHAHEQAVEAEHEDDREQHAREADGERVQTLH